MSRENIARETEGRILEEEQLVQEGLRYEKGRRTEEIVEGSRDEMKGGGNMMPVLLVIKDKEKLVK